MPRITRRVDVNPNDLRYQIQHPRFDLILSFIIDELHKTTPEWSQFQQCILCCKGRHTPCNIMNAFLLHRSDPVNNTIIDGYMRIQAVQYAVNEVYQCISTRLSLYNNIPNEVV